MPNITHRFFDVANAQRAILMVLASFLMICPGAARAFNVEAGSFVKAPAHCQAKLAALGERGATWGYKVLDLRRYDIDRYERLMGNAWKHMHHYCGALDMLIRYEDYAWKASKKTRRAGLLRRMLVNFNYQLEQTRWTDSLLWFKAEVLKNKARAYRLGGQRSDAISSFQAAIRTYPPYLPAYWDLADLYENIGSYDLAQETLREALPHARKNTYKRIIDEKLRQLSEIENEGLQKAENGRAADGARAD